MSFSRLVHTLSKKFYNIEHTWGKKFHDFSFSEKPNCKYFSFLRTGPRFNQDSFSAYFAKNSLRREKNINFFYFISVEENYLSL